MAQILDKNSNFATRSEVDYFSVPATQVALDGGFWSEIHLTHPLTDNGPYEFRVPPDPNYIDLSKNYILLEFSVRNVTGVRPTASIADAEGAINFDYSTINLLGKTIFKQVKIFLQNKLIEDSSDLYAYKTYLQTELNTGILEKDSTLAAAFYHRDEHSKFDFPEAGSGLITRAKLLNGGTTVQCIAPINAAIFNQDRFLPSHIDVRLELHRNSDEFCMLQNAASRNKIKIEKMSWFVYKVELQPALALGIETYLSKNLAKLPIRRLVGRTVNIERGCRDIPNIILSHGVLPRRIVLTFVNTLAFFGSNTLNPMKFLPYNVKQITITAGDKKFPRNDVVMDFSSHKYVQGYLSTLEAINALSGDKPLGITLSDYKNGFFFHTVDLTASSTDGEYWELLREGTLSCRIVFNSDVTEDIKMVFFLEYDSLIGIDKNRNIVLDYNM
jgi:hypothetical protein